MKKTITFLFITVSIIACNKNKFTPECNGSTPTYDNDIKTIIDANCTGSSCHGSGSKNDDFTTYSGLSHALTDGDFEKRVLSKQNMPKGGELSESELNLIQCWADNEYPEN